MILSKLVVKWLEVIVEIGLWLILVLGFVAGFSMGSGFFGSLGLGLAVMMGCGIAGAMLFGFFILMNSINRAVAQLLTIANGRPAG